MKPAFIDCETVNLCDAHTALGDGRLPRDTFDASGTALVTGYGQPEAESGCPPIS
jgi:hypothetical protein